ncbi:hypothetical protein MH124_16510, partial [Bacillus safensis]|uniref:hypothetical protein n=1 Tax=Bacillus safensis TaxID=561879 RepID=UPI00227FE453
WHSRQYHHKSNTHHKQQPQSFQIHFPSLSFFHPYYSVIPKVKNPSPPFMQPSLLDGTILL